jgi:hypothetical protein
VNLDVRSGLLWKYFSKPAISLIFCFSASAQILLDPCHAFTGAPNWRASYGINEASYSGASIRVFFDITAVAPDAELRCEIYENSFSQAPLGWYTAPLTNVSGRVVFFQRDAWADEQGVFRLTMTRGTAQISRIEYQFQRPYPCTNCTSPLAVYGFGFEIPTGPLVDYRKLSLIRNGSELMIAWPRCASNSVVQSSASATPGSDWRSLTNTTVSNGVYSIMLSPTNTQNFFRSVRPFPEPSLGGTWFVSEVATQ